MGNCFESAPSNHHSPVLPLRILMFKFPLDFSIYLSIIDLPPLLVPPLKLEFAFIQTVVT